MALADGYWPGAGEALPVSGMSQKIDRYGMGFGEELNGPTRVIFLGLGDKLLITRLSQLIIGLSVGTLR